MNHKDSYGDCYEFSSDVNASCRNPYVQITPTPPSQRTMTDVVFDAAKRCGNKVETATRQAETLADGVFTHLKLTPSLTKATMARIVQTAQVILEGHKRVFQQQFGIIPEEKLFNSFVCYISTSSGPLMGNIYISDRRVTFCSDYPLRFSSPTGDNESAYYKVILQLKQIRSINPSVNKSEPSGKYINVVMQDGNEFWFMGFVLYDKALECLNNAFQGVHGRRKVSKWI